MQPDGRWPARSADLHESRLLRELRIPLARGQLFEVTDDLDAPPVAIVGERTARRLWGNADTAVGRRLRFTWNQNRVGGGGGDDLWLTVVGVGHPGSWTF